MPPHAKKIEKTMTILLDPEHNESNALFSLPFTWTGTSVLEIGSGDGRLTWRFAEKASRVVALEPDADKYATALVNRTSRFEHVEFLNLGLEEFVRPNKEKFDLALLSWSL